MIKISDQLFIPREELTFTAARSSGPGGQHVNKASTRVMLRFDVAKSPSLSEEQKALILARLATRISKEGILRVVSQQTRSQAANKELAVERFIELLQQALRKKPPRKKTAISTAAKQRRLDEKKRKSRLKKGRSWQIQLDE